MARGWWQRRRRPGRRRPGRQRTRRRGRRRRPSGGWWLQAGRWRQLGRRRRQGLLPFRQPDGDLGDEGVDAVARDEPAVVAAPAERLPQAPRRGRIPRPEHHPCAHVQAASGAPSGGRKELPSLLRARLLRPLKALLLLHPRAEAVPPLQAPPPAAHDGVGDCHDGDGWLVDGGGRLLAVGEDQVCVLSAVELGSCGPGKKGCEGDHRLGAGVGLEGQGGRRAAGSGGWRRHRRGECSAGLEA